MRGISGNRSAGRHGTGLEGEDSPRGTRASANTSGPDFTWARECRWNCGPQDPHRTKKTCFFCRTGFQKSELPKKSIQPFDLMSRRHPLSSTRAAYPKSASRSKSSWRLLWRAGIKSPAIFWSEIYFFLETLRVFFAVFFTALFAFLAFLAMLPSW